MKALAVIESNLKKIYVQVKAGIHWNKGFKPYKEGAICLVEGRPNTLRNFLICCSVSV